MKITSAWLLTKNACRDTLEWFNRTYTEVNHVELYSILVATGRYDWAGWLCIQLLSTSEERAKLAILAAMHMPQQSPEWTTWANRWLLGKDRSEDAAMTIARRVKAIWLKESAWAAVWATYETMSVTDVVMRAVKEVIPAGVNLLDVLREMEIKAGEPE